MSVNQAFQVVGTIVGAYFGAPQLGFMIGSAIGNAVDPMVIKGPTIGDIATQTSQEGVPRPIVFGMSPPIAGNIIATGPARKVVKTKRQGKGGPKVKTEHLFRTYAIGICEGPIGRVVRVWRNSELVFDDKDDDELNYHDFTNAETVKFIFRRLTNNTVFKEKVQFFEGTYDQEPPAELEQIFGVGETPAHRGTAYMLVVDDDLTDLRGAIPQFMFQVEMNIDGESVVVFTEDGVWTKPPFLAEAEVTVIAGGAGGRGGGGHYSTTPHSGGGGGAGGLSVETFEAADLPSTVNVTVGLGGSGGAGGNNVQIGSQGGVGGDSSFGAFVAASGGEVGNSFSGGDGGVGATEDGGHGGAGAAGPAVGSGEHGLPGENRDAAPGGGGGGGVLDNVVSSISGPGEGGAGGNSGSVLGGSAGVGVVITSGSSNAVGSPGVDGSNSDSFGGGGGGGGGGCAGKSAGGGQAIAGDGGNGGKYGGGGGGGGNASRVGSGANSFGGDGGDGHSGVVVVRQTFVDITTDLPDVVTALCERAGLPASLIDVSLLSGPVYGFVVINRYPCAEALRALSQIYFFEAVPIDGKVHFIPRGRNAVATISEDELLDDEEEIEQDKRSDPISIPRVLNLNYYDVLGGLAPDKQTSERSGDRRAVGEQQLQTAVMMTADGAAQVVAKNHKVMIEDQKGELKFSLSDKYIGLVPTDNIFLTWDSRTERLRIAKNEMFDGYQQYIALRDRQSAYQSTVQGIPASPTQLPANNAVGPTLLEVLDIPILHDSDDAVGLCIYIAIAGVSDAWQGATVELSYDGGATYTTGEDVSTPTVMGQILTEMSDHPAEYPDDENVIQVRIDTLDGELESTDLAGMFNRTNLAVIGNEIVQFANAVETTDGVWELSYFLRGRKGTATELHTANSRFVMLDNLSPIPATLSDLNRTLTFRATSLGATTDTATVKSIGYVGNCQRERAPGYLEAHRTGSNIEVSWQGVGRLGGGVNTAHGVRFVGYQVTFDDGVTQIEVETLDQEYTQPSAGLGSPVTVSVAQLNDLTGAGPSTEVTIV